MRPIATMMLALLVASAGSAAAPAVAQAQDRQMGGSGLTVFEDIDYRGQNATFREDEPDLSRYRLDRRISSLRAAPGEMWEVCANTDFRDPCQLFSGAVPDLRSRNWNDRIRSVRLVRGGPGRGGRGWSPVPAMVLYSSERYRGQELSVTTARPSLGSFTDRARSVRVIDGRWEICEDTNYRRCRQVVRDVPSLEALGLSGRVSSVRPVNSGVVPPGTAVPRGALTMFDASGYRGASLRIDSADAALGGVAGRARSVRVDGTWELCEGRNFTGRCITATGDIPDLSSAGLNNRIGSARPIYYGR